MNEPKDYEYLLLCDGSTISEENYPELVAVLGGTQLPNLIDRFLQGAATAGTYKAAGLPNITGQLQAWGDRGNAFEKVAGAFKVVPTGQLYYALPADRTQTNAVLHPIVDFYASNSNSIYGSSTTVQPPAFTTKIYICYL